MVFRRRWSVGILGLYSGTVTDLRALFRFWTPQPALRVVRRLNGQGSTTSTRYVVLHDGQPVEGSGDLLAR